MSVTPFGPKFTRALSEGAERLNVLPEWICDVIALESGFLPLIMNGALCLSTGVDDRRPQVDGANGMVLENGTGAKGLWQKMPTVLETWPDTHAWKRIRLYSTVDPAQQLTEAVAFWYAMKSRLWGPSELPSREHFYVLNLYPAKVKASDLVLFASPSAAYAANRYTLDPQNTGRVTIPMLAPALDTAHARCEQRISCELRALDPSFVGPL